MKSGALFAIALAALTLSCSHKLQTTEAVRKGVIKSVASKGITPESMDVAVSHVDFNGNHAEAVVSFVPKGGKISDGLTMRYKLEQRGDEWVVTDRSGLNMQQHAGSMQSAPSMMGHNSDSVDPMPNALPGVDSSRPLPAGHPPVGGANK